LSFGTFITLVLLVAILAAPFVVARLLPRELEEKEPQAPGGPKSIAFLKRAEHGTAAWREAMKAVGDRMRAHQVAAVVFVHGTFTGHDPMSAAAVVERVLPSLAQTVKRATRGAIERVLGDVGVFGDAYVREYETAIGGDIACTSFGWSSENHHVGRLQGALDLVRVLATHAELSRGRVLVIGHSHAAQLFALVTQLLADTIASEAVLDVARARKLDLGSLDRDLELLVTTKLDFVTLGAPTRYAWADLETVRVLHVVHERDLIRRLGVAGSDFPALDADARRANAALDAALGPGFAPAELVRSLRAGALHERGEIAFVDYGKQRLAHGVYTRLEGMLFHAELVASRLYREPAAVPSASRWRALARAWK